MRTITHWLVTIIAAFALSSGASAQTPIRIAVAATAPAADAAVSKVAARAPHIVIFDGEGKLLEATRIRLPRIRAAPEPRSRAG